MSDDWRRRLAEGVLVSALVSGALALVRAAVAPRPLFHPPPSADPLQGPHNALTIPEGAPAWAGDFEGYLRALDAYQRRWLPQLRSLYNRDRLRRITRAAAAWAGVPPEWPWGIMWRESRWLPVGVAGGSAAVALQRRDSGMGMGQFLKSRWDREAEWLSQHAPMTWTHAELLHPKLSIWGIAASLARGVEHDGGGPDASPADQVRGALRWSQRDGGLRVGHWWAGASVRRARRKTRDVAAKGPDVWRSDGGATYPVDDVPPWGGTPVAAGPMRELPLVGAA